MTAKDSELEPVRLEFQIRMDAVERLLDTVPDADDAADGHHQDIKGFVFVSMYAAYERLIKQSFRVYLEVASAEVEGSLAEVPPTLRAIALEPLLKSIRDRKESGLWWQDAARELDNRLVDTCAVISSAFFPEDGSFFRESQVRVVWQSMGVPGDPAAVLGPAWGELEQIRRNRNRIAHGEVSADAVGARYSISQLRQTSLHWRGGWLSYLTECEQVLTSLRPASTTDPLSGRRTLRMFLNLLFRRRAPLPQNLR